MAFMAAAMPFISMASTALSVIGSLQQASAASASAQAQANAQEWNATIERQRAQQALEVGNVQEEAKRRESRQRMGQLRAGLVENGMSLTDGSGADLVEQSALNSEMDALNIRYGAQMNARGYQLQAQQDEYGADVSRSNADQATTAGYFGAASAALSGAGNYYNYTQQQRLYKAQSNYYGLT